MESGTCKPKRECDLYPAVRDWLRARGFAVYVERFGADVIGMKDGRLVAVELKLGCTSGLVRQLKERAKWANEVWAAVPVHSDRRDYSEFAERGFGFLHVVGPAAEVKMHATECPPIFPARHTYRIKMLANELPAMDHELAGLPACAALREQRIRRLPPAPEGADTRKE